MRSQEPTRGEHVDGDGPVSRPLAVAFGLAITLGLAACGLTSLDYLHDGQRLPDAGADANVDAPDGTIADGSPDGGPGVGFCSGLAPPPVFCADFDEGSLATAFLSGTSRNIGAPQVDPGCSASLIGDGDAMSPPAAFLATTGAFDGGEVAVVIQAQDLTGAASARLRFSMRLLDLPGSIEEVDLATLTFGSPDGGQPLHAYFSVQGTGRIQMQPASSTTTCALPSGTGWHEVELAAHVGPTAAATVTVDGTLLCTSTAGPTPFDAPTTIELRLGSIVISSKPAPATQVAFDNVVLVEP
jgi:hypothetical protein